MSDGCPRHLAHRGTQLPQAILTEETVASILKEFVPYSRTHGARRLQVHVNTIWKVTSRDSWAHVRDPRLAA